MKLLLLLLLTAFLVACNPKIGENLRKNDLRRDVEMLTTKGPMVLRLSDSTPLHRNNFLALVKQGYYDSILFHRVIRQFMIQAGDPDSKRAVAGARLGSGGPGKTIPAEFVPGLFHHKGALAAARMGDNVNPDKASSGSQFYIVQGRVFSSAGLDSVETMRMKGYRFPQAHRQSYMQIGGAPHLDQNYTVFGKVIRGLDIIDSIAGVKTAAGDRPVDDVRILRMRLIRRVSER